MHDPSFTTYSPAKQTRLVTERGFAYFAAIVLAVFALLASGGVQPAAGATAAGADPTSVGGVTVESLHNGEISVGVGEIEYTVMFNEADGTATVVQPDGTPVTVATGDLPTEFSQSRSILHGGESLAGPVSATASSAAAVTCNVLMWAIGLIHSAGWGIAIPIIAASGPVGATIAVSAYALGANGFLFWVGTQCPS